MGLLYGENSLILTSTVFDSFTRVTDRRTDRQAIAYSALCEMLSRAKNYITFGFYGTYIPTASAARIGLHLVYGSSETAYK